jgi:hypothetical protein
MRIIGVKHIKNYILEIRLQNGTTKRVNLRKGLMHAKNPMNTKYRNVNLFKKVKIEGGDLIWGKDHEMSLLGEDVITEGDNLLLV